MGAHAVVIGIDRYTKHPEWNLTGAVNDAVEFAKWVTTQGGVDPNDLTLLLSPLKGVKAPKEFPNIGKADLKTIADLLTQYELKQKKADGRLWFYYAGHGLAAAGQGPSAGPVLVPADTDSLDTYRTHFALRMEDFRQLMQDTAETKEQFYFIDACRALVQSKDNKTLTTQIYWQPGQTGDDKLATQVVFLATSAGKDAKELRGEGIFSRVLLAALKGMGPKLERPKNLQDAQKGKRSLTFNNLTSFVRDAAEKALAEVPGMDADEITSSLPFATITRVIGDVEIAQYDGNALPNATIAAVVEPTDARKKARIEFVQWSSNNATPFITLQNPQPVGPPVKAKETFVVPGGTHTVRVETDGYEPLLRDLLVWGDKSFLLELEKQKKPRGLEALGYESMTPGTGHLTVTSPDRLTRLSVLDSSGQAVMSYIGAELRTDLKPGAYVVRAELSGLPTKEEAVIVYPGRRTERKLDIGNGNYEDRSENLGPVANAKFSSLLAYAAWAARWPETQGFHRLREEGVDPLPGLAKNGSAVQVLIGDKLSKRAVDCYVQIDGDDLPLAPLPKQPARQGALLAKPGSMRVRVEMPGFVPTTFALTLLPRFVTVLIVTREENGLAEVQQHFNPIDPMRRVSSRFGPPKKDDVRIVEIGARALEHREPLAENDYQRLVARKGSNPMFGLIAGYRRAKGFAGTPLDNMLAAFPGLPDVHVLAGLYDTKNRDAHFRRAMEAGTPVFAQGFWTLFDWMTQQALKKNLAPPVLRQELTAGMVWTSFVDTPPAEKADRVRIVTSSGRTSLATITDDRGLTGAARSVGRIRPDDGSFLSTAFLVAPRIAVVPVHVAEGFAKLDAAGAWRIIKPTSIRFDLADPKSTRRITDVLRTVRPRKNAKVLSGSIDNQLLDTCWPVLVRLDEDAPAPPLTIAPAASEAGERVAVIGFPTDSGNAASSTFADHFVGASGEKHVMPGIILRAPGNTWTLDHNCFTAPGTSGGPIMNHSGQVIGMHVVGRPTKEGFKEGIGVALTRFGAEAFL